MPTGRVKWYDTEKGFGFLTRDEGEDVFVHKAALPAGVAELKPGQKVEFGIAAGRKGDQALQVKVLEAPPSLVEAERLSKRRPADELNTLIEDMIKVLEAKILPDLKRGRYPDKKIAHKIAEALHVIAREMEY
ncbi:cold-shock protein CspA [Rhizocola hellebori]|uniref:Cold-shock protein CspA n=1 Tax=Rhizocola hellebori TaxID=1392758 RepID=A0A8J3QII7_9ACTN|nr:cold-shock protein [Rhizocola hellebori]GIH11490.1 cold-shock protein CspA [Rhizocola hellebori]